MMRPLTWTHDHRILVALVFCAHRLSATEHLRARLGHERRRAKLIALILLYRGHGRYVAKQLYMIQRMPNTSKIDVDAGQPKKKEEGGNSTSTVARDDSNTNYSFARREEG